MKSLTTKIVAGVAIVGSLAAVVALLGNNGSQALSRYLADDQDDSTQAF